MAPRHKKNERHYFWEILAMMYVFLLIGVAISSTLFSAVIKETEGNKLFHRVFFVIMYITSTLVVIGLMVYIRKWNSTMFVCEEIKAKLEKEVTAHRLSQIEVHTNDEKDNLRREKTRNDELPYVALNGEGFNTFLKVGLGAFLVGSVIYNLIRVITPFMDNPLCRSKFGIVVDIFEIIFLVSQSIFIYMNDKVIFLKHRPYVKMALAHLVTTNLCLWAYKSIGEIKEGVISDSTKNETSHDAIKCENEEKIKELVLPFLNPAVIEYALLAAPMLLEILSKVGDIEEIVSKEEEEKEERDLKRTLMKYRKGILSSAVVFVLTVVIVIVVYQVTDQLSAFIVYLVQDFLLGCLAIVLCAFALTKIRNLRFVKMEKHSFDDKLLLIALFGTFLHQLVNIGTLVSGFEDLSLAFVGADVVTQIVNLVEAGLQALVILDGLRRRMRRNDTAMPGRTLVAMLFGINLALWLMKTFEVRKAHDLASMSTSGGSVAIRIFLHMTLPFAILYRFHSSVTFSLIWFKSYEKAD